STSAISAAVGLRPVRLSNSAATSAASGFGIRNSSAFFPVPFGIRELGRRDELSRAANGLLVFMNHLWLAGQMVRLARYTTYVVGLFSAGVSARCDPSSGERSARAIWLRSVSEHRVPSTRLPFDVPTCRCFSIPRG